MTAHKTVFVAHRGAWKAKGLPQNSMAALQEAEKAGYDFAEFDLHLGEDGTALLTHDRVINGLDVCTTKYSLLPLLSNNECLPRLSEIVNWLKTIRKDFKLYVELKSVNETTINEKLGDAALLVCLQIIDRIRFISFDINILQQLKAANKRSITYYLGGDKSPAEVAKNGIDGMNYHYNVLLDHPEYFSQAKILGLHIGAWTVNDAEVAEKLLNLSVNSITSDEEDLLNLT